MTRIFFHSSLKKLLLKTSKNLRENACVGVSFLIKLLASDLQFYEKRDSNTGVFLWSFQNFYKHLFTEHLQAIACVWKHYLFWYSFYNWLLKCWLESVWVHGLTMSVFFVNRRWIGDEIWWTWWFWKPWWNC